MNPLVMLSMKLHEDTDGNAFLSLQTTIFLKCVTDFKIEISVPSESWRLSVLCFVTSHSWLQCEMWCKPRLHNLQFGFSVVFVTKPLCNSSITENVCRIIECHVSITVAHDVIVTWQIPPDSTCNCGGLPSYTLFTIIILYITGITFLILCYIYIWRLSWKSILRNVM